MLEEYDRVTQVLYPFSGLDKIDSKIVEHAAERGQRVHSACNAIIDGLGAFADSDIIGYLKSFEMWAKDKKFAPHPDRWYCNERMITGECDGIYENETGYTLYDLKTPQRESKTWILQGSAYLYLSKSLDPKYKINKIEFVKLDKNGGKPISYFYEPDIEMFFKCLDIYRRFFK